MSGDGDAGDAGEGLTGDVAQAPAANVNGGLTDAPSNTGWYRSFSEGLDADTAKAWTATASRYKTSQDFVKANTELRKSYDSRVPLPDPNDGKGWETWWQKHGERMGRPSEPNGYTYDFADTPWDDTERNQLEEYKTVAHRNGISGKAYAEQMKYLAESRKLVEDAKGAKAGKLEYQRNRELQAAWQFEYEQNVSMYSAAVDRYAQDDATEFKRTRLDDGTLVQNHPVIANMVVRAGRATLEDDRDFSFTRQANVGPHGKIEQMEEELADKYGPTHKWPKDKQEELVQLYKKAYGGKGQSPHTLYGRGSGS